MIRGQVGHREGEGHQAVIPLRVTGTEGRNEIVAAAIDIGFTDYLVLPPDTIRRLLLPPRRSIDALLAGDLKVAMKVYDAFVEFDDATFEVEADGPPLVGLALLTGFRLTVEVTTGGEVTVERLP